MTKIGVFGDSFAANPHLEWNNTAEGFIREVYKGCKRKYSKEDSSMVLSKWGEKYIGWHRNLDADVYGQSGSDLYYSYNQFVKNQQKYEKCIFIITSPFRYSTNFNGWVHCASYEDAVEKIEFAKNYSDKQYFKSLTKFFKDVYYKDDERENLLTQAIIDSIKLARPDTIFINAYPDLKHVYDLELEFWNTTEQESQDYKKYFDLRHCHMTNENNKILADFIKNNINKSGYLDLSNVEWNTTTLKSNYLVKTNNLIDWLLS